MRKATTILCSLSLLALSFGGTSTLFAAETAAPAQGDAAGSPATMADAKIASVKGAETRVNQGEGYAPAPAGMLLKVGDGLFAGAESQIVITYLKQGCSQLVPAKSVARVEAVAPCLKSGASLGTQAISVPAGQAGTVSTPAVADAPGFCESSPELCVGGLLATTAVVTVAIIALSSDDDDDDDDPASPD